MGFLTRDPLIPGTCEWCGQGTKSENHATCSPSCEAKLYAADRELGAEIVTALKLWRRHRGRKGTPGEGKISAVATKIDEALKRGTARRRAAADARKADRDKAARAEGLKLSDRQREALLAIGSGEDVSSNSKGTMKSLKKKGYLGPDSALSEKGNLVFGALREDA